MANLNDFVADNIFVIDSNNCGIFDARLYGYLLEDGIIRINGMNGAMVDRWTAGMFAAFHRDGDCLILQQDYYGLQGLYIFRNNDYFAVSNSMLYLIAYLANRFKLTVNPGFACNFITSMSTSECLETTCVKEIDALLPNNIVKINIKNKSCEVLALPYDDHVIAWDSGEAIDLLDSIHEKYSNLLNFLINNDYPVSVDLSGGMDSRVVLSLLSAFGFSKKINFNTALPRDCSYSEDYEIAKLIGQLCGFGLNTRAFSNTRQLSFNHSLLFALLSKFFYNSQLYIFRSCLDPMLFHFTGFGGEIWRNYDVVDRDTFLKTHAHWPVFKSVNLVNPAKMQLASEINKIFNMFKLNMNDGQQIYRLTRLRYHFGKSMFEAFLTNRINIAPLLDPKLALIDFSTHTDDLDSLYALIIDRYLPLLTNLKFDNKRYIRDETWKKAARINALKEIKKSSPPPPTHRHNVCISDSRLGLDEDAASDNNNLHSYMKNCLDSQFFKTILSDTQLDEIRKFCKTYADKHPERPSEFIIRFFFNALLHKIVASQDSDIHINTDNSIAELLFEYLAN